MRPDYKDCIILGGIHCDRLKKLKEAGIVGRSSSIVGGDFSHASAWK